MDLELTEAELRACEPHIHRSGSEDEWSGPRRVAEAATRKALWTLQRRMATQGSRDNATSLAWGYCAQNVGYWLEMDWIEPWPQEATDA